MNENYFHETSNHEWILTNKLGGYALGTGNLINQRKYHGLLIASDANQNRYHLLAGMEIMIEWRGETFFLDSTNYSNCIYPEGFLHLVKSWLRPYPVFLYSSLHHNNDILIKKEIMMADKENSIIVKLTNLGSHKLNYLIRPKLTMRNHHDTNPKGIWDNHPNHLSLDDKQFSFVHNNLTLFCRVVKGRIERDRVIYRDCYYPWEAIRGYYGVEDQIAPVKITFHLQPNETNYLIFSDRESNLSPEGLNDQDREALVSKMIKRIEKKYLKLPKPKDYPAYNTPKEPLLHNLDYNDQIMFEYEDYLKILEFSLMDFLLEDNVIAGYPWFGCWGRDTFIFFDALLKSSVSYRILRKIIQKYASMTRNGLIPNMLSESGNDLNYSSIDATLWFVLNIYGFVNKVVTEQLHGKKAIIKESIKYIEQIIKGLTNPLPEQPFYVSENGLLYLKEEFASATWMDAKVNDKGVTPRNGAPVEINALFYNALNCFRELNERFPEYGTVEKPLLDRVNHLIPLIKKSFALFRTDDYLADRLSEERPVRECRPNALIASSLPFPLLEPEELKEIFHVAARELATPYGIRTLAPSEYQFKKKYLGNQAERDSQYHQGTVWAWLFDPYIKTYYNAFKDTKSASELINDISKIISKLRNGYMKGHIASISEVWDGDRPHFPKGCPAQAWSVAALYNIETLINELMDSP